MAEPSAPARRAGRPSSPAFSREAAAEAVADLVRERGYEGWSMRDLAARLGVSIGTLTHHFASREDVALAAVDHIYALPADWEDIKARDPVERLRRMCAAFVLSSPGRRRWSRFWVEYMAAAARLPEVQQRQEERYARQLRFFTSLVADCLPPARAADAEHEATRLVALGNGLAVQQLASPGVVSASGARAILDQHIAALCSDSAPAHDAISPSPRARGEGAGA
jgi:AcrR family transcriptional regulator